MSLRPLAVGFVAVACAVAAPNKRPDAPKEIDFCPLQVGNTWEFDMLLGGNTSVFTTRVTGTEKVDGREVFELKREVDGRANGASQLLLGTREGLLKYRISGQDVTPPQCLIKYPFKPGDKWTSKVRIGDRETEIHAVAGEPAEVEVPAGKFKGHPVTTTEDQSGVVTETTYWFVPDVGVALQSATRDGNAWYTYKLRKFTPAAKDRK